MQQREDNGPKSILYLLREFMKAMAKWEQWDAGKKQNSEHELNTVETMNCH